MDDPQSFLLFPLGKETFGLPALLVRAVLDKDTLVPVPLAPPFVLGAANVHGRVVCVVDVAALLTLAKAEEQPYWLVVDLPDGQLALAVSEVRQSPPGASIEKGEGGTSLPAVEYGAHMDGEFFRVLSLRAMYDYMMSRMG